MWVWALRGWPLRLLMPSEAQAEMETAWIDHRVLGVADLDSVVQSFQQRMGVTATNGKHPGAGSHKFLADLGGQSKLEILAPLPAAKPHPRWAGLADLDALTPLVWPGIQSIERARDLLPEDGCETTPARASSRITTHSSTLAWQTSPILQLHRQAAADYGVHLGAPLPTPLNGLSTHRGSKRPSNRPPSLASDAHPTAPRRGDH